MSGIRLAWRASLERLVATPPLFFPEGRIRRHAFRYPSMARQQPLSLTA